TTVARWESGEYSPQPWLRPKIARAFELSLSGLSELVDGVERTGSTVKASASVVTADGVAASLAGCDQGPAAERERHERLSQELVEAYAETNALRTTTRRAQTPWDTDRLAVLTAQAIVAALATVAEGEQAVGLAGPLVSLESLSTITQPIPTDWEDRLY